MLGNSKAYLIGDERETLRDTYHWFLRAPWWASLSAIAVGFLVANVIFAVAYMIVGGVATARPGSFVDAFFFSAQTMATIGYGVLHPVSAGANTVVIVESIVGIIVTALCTGLVFGKFSRSTARIRFSNQAVITPMDGKPTLMFRVGNERGNTIIEATIRVVLSRTERSLEGSTFYRMYDLQLVRDRSPAMTRSWTVMHTIDEKSPMFGVTPEQLANWDAELIVSLTGTDDISIQVVHARHIYDHVAVKCGFHFVDILAELDGGAFVVDLRHFHDVVPDPT